MLLKRLIEILKTFDKEELKKFRRFISSDYFNTNESIVKLFKLIAAFYPDFSTEEKKLTPEALFKGVYGARKYDEKTLRYLISSLYSLAEKYLAYNTLEKSPLEMRKHVIDNMVERRLFSLAEKNLDAANADLEKDPEIDGEYIYNKMDYAFLKHQLYFLSNKQDPIFKERVERAEYHLYGSLVEMVHNYQIIITVSLSYNIPLYDNMMFSFLRNVDYPKVIAEIEKAELEKSYSEDTAKLYKTLKIYLCFLVTMLDEKEEKYLEMMNSLVEEHIELFGKPEQQNLHVMLTTACTVKRKNIDDKKYLHKYFDVIKRGVSRNLYTSYTSQYMDINNFIMIFKTALQLNENEWAAEFLRNYGERISPEFSEDMINYAFAELFFAKQQFERSHSSLSKVSMKIFRLKIPVRVLMLRLYYELGYIEEAFSLIDSFTRFLSTNNKIKIEEKNTYLKFLGFYRDVLKAKSDGVYALDKENMDKLESTALLPHKDWLLEKVNNTKAA